MIEKCNTCVHRNICVLKNHIQKDTCIDYMDENRTFNTKYGLYDHVFIIDRFDIVNNCSQYGDGSGSKEIELVVRECFITSITVPDHQKNYLYRIQPCKLTERESNDIKTHYWDQSWYDKSIFDDKDKAIAYLEDLGFKDIRVL